MATDLERLIVQLSADIRKFEKSFARAQGISTKTFNSIERRARTFDRRLERVGAGFRRSILATTAGLGAAFSAREIKLYADTWTQAGNKIRASGQVAERAGRSLEGIVDIANESRTGITETADLYSKLLRATKDVAKSELEVARATIIVNKAFKAGGAALSEQRAGILQLSQALGSGLLQGDELRSVRENAPLIAQALAREFNTTIAGLKKLGADGELAIDRVFKAILNAQPDIEAAFGKTNATIADSFTRVNNAFTQYIGQADASNGASRQLVLGLNALADSFETTADIAIKIAAIFAAGILGRSVGKLAGDLLLGTGALLSFSKALIKVRSVGSIATVLRGVGIGAAGPIGLTVAAASTALFLYTRSLDDSGESSEAAARKAEVYAHALREIEAAAKDAGDSVDDLAREQDAFALRIDVETLGNVRDELERNLGGLRDLLRDNADQLDRVADLMDDRRLRGISDVSEDEIRAVRAQANEFREWGRAIEGTTESADELRQNINNLALTSPGLRDLANKVTDFTTEIDKGARSVKNLEDGIMAAAEAARGLSGIQLELSEKGIRLDVNRGAAARDEFLGRRLIESQTGQVARPTGRDRFEVWQVIGRTSAGRKIVVNPEGGLSTQLLETTQDPRGGFMNVPTLFDGKPVSIQEAVDRVIAAGFTDAETGRFIESFETIAAAVDNAKALSRKLDQDSGVIAAQRQLALGPGFELVQADVANRTDKILKDFEKAAEEAANLGDDLGTLNEATARKLAIDQLAAEATAKLTQSQLDAATNLILGNEGRARLTPFRDINERGEPDQLRIGFSSDTVTLLDRAGNEIVQNVVAGMRITMADAMRDFVRRIKEGREEIAGQIGQERFDALTATQQAVLSDIEYNFGRLPGQIVNALIEGDAGDVAREITKLGIGTLNQRRRAEGGELFLQGAGAEVQLREGRLKFIKETSAAIAQQNQMIGLETSLIEASNAVREAAIFRQERLNQLAADGIPITDKVIAQVDRETAARFNKLAAYDAEVERVRKLDEAQDDLIRQQQELAGAFEGALRGFISDLVAGKNATEALANAVGRLADQLLQIALNRIFASLFSGPLGFAGGGLARLKDGGQIRRLQHGGLIRGPGGPRDDQIPVLASNKEFIVNARATRDNRQLLEAINSGKVKSFADGGFIGSRKPGIVGSPGFGGTAPAPVVNNNVINTFDAAGFLSEALASPEGENIMLNFVSARPAAFSAALQG